MKRYPRIIIAGTNSGVGKTTLTLGVILALKKKGLKVSSFKVGPDYIDPTFHSQITKNACYNLDGWMLSKDTILELFEAHAEKSDISIIEGVMGLYDGLKGEEEGSTAHIAKILKCPVILIINAQALSRSAAAIALGYKEFDKGINIKGIILNNIASDKHYQYIKNSIENKVKIAVLGFIPKDSNLKIPNRHLGLIPAYEIKLEDNFSNNLQNIILKNIKIDKIIKIAKESTQLSQIKKNIFVPNQIKEPIVIALAKDKAFNFYYQDNLNILKRLGVKIIEFSPLKDKKLPNNIQGVYIGGGFPEIFAQKLSQNNSLKEEIRQHAKKGMPIFAECGGLMYLMQELVDSEKRLFKMVGIFKGKSFMADKLQALGYAETKTIKNNILSRKGQTNRVHLFHWSCLSNRQNEKNSAFSLEKDNKVFYDGLISKNVLATYSHFHFASNINFAKNFIKSCREFKND